LKTWVKILLAATGAVLLASWGAFFTAPLDLKDGLELLQMRLHGVRDVRSGGLHALFKDDCRPGLPCACVALIHGLGDSSIRWHKTLLTTDEQWREAGLKDTALKLYAFDLPGVGSSDAPAQFADYRVRTIARTLRGAMEPLCPSWIVVGNSLRWTGAREWTS
jgi:pimeloyl-ACP methyl ester carboxylesterase